MHARFLLSLLPPLLLGAGLAGLVGCGPDGKPRNVGDEYVRGALDQRGQAQSIVSTLAIDKAVDMFQLQKGRLPASLAELKKEGFLPQMPSPPPGKAFQYNAKTGKVTLVDQ